MKMGQEEASARGADEPAKQLHERGFIAFEGSYSEEEVSFFREQIARRYDTLGRLTTFARPPLLPAPDVEISVVGLIFHKLGNHFPEFAPLLLKPEVVEAARAALGRDMHLEYACAVVCNDARPFFPWHAHVGGVDNVVYRKQGIFPTFERSERLTSLLYLDDLTDEAGTLLVYPRRIDEPTRPPYDPRRENWEGQVELSCTRGTLVLLEQCTWHAARSKRSPGLRAFIACYFTSCRAPKTSWVDTSFRAWAAEGSPLASILPEV
jgi:hypothetical protein